MFKNPIDKDSLNKAKISKKDAKTIRNFVLETYPNIKDFIEEIWPKDADVQKSKITVDEFNVFVYLINDEIKFMENRSKIYIPTLRILHRYPFMMPHMQCDKGAIKHILSGSNVMCPGLTSPGGRMDNVKEGTVVAIMAEGKDHAMGIGVTAMSTEDIQRINKDVAIELMEALNDGLWKITIPPATE